MRRSYCDRYRSRFHSLPVIFMKGVLSNHQSVKFDIIAQLLSQIPIRFTCTVLTLNIPLNVQLLLIDYLPAQNTHNRRCRSRIRTFSCSSFANFTNFFLSFFFCPLCVLVQLCSLLLHRALRVKLDDFRKLSVLFNDRLKWHKWL